MEQAYIGKLEENGDAKIQFLKEIVDGQDIEVETKTRLKDGSEYSVNYKLKFTPAGWRAYDVVVEGVSLVNNYRSQFDRLLSKKSSMNFCKCFGRSKQLQLMARMFLSSRSRDFGSQIFI